MAGAGVSVSLYHLVLLFPWCGVSHGAVVTVAGAVVTVAGAVVNTIIGAGTIIEFHYLLIVN